MRQVLVPGKSVEIPTLEEIERVVRARVAQRDERLLRTSENFKTDGAGAGTLDQLYAVPVGFEAVLYRWVIAYVDGSTPGTLFTAAAGWIELLADEQRVDWIRLQDGIPNKVSWSSNQGPVIANGQRLGVLISGGPVNTNIEVRIQGILRRAEPVRRH